MYNKRVRTLSELLDEFLAHLALEKNYSKHTTEAYSRHLNAVVSQLSKTTFESQPSKLTADKIRGELVKYFSPQRSLPFQAQCISALKHFLRYLYNSGILPEDEAQYLNLPHQPQRLPKIITEEEIFALLNAPDTQKPTGLRDRALLETLYGAGLRISEAIELSISALSLTDGTLRVLGKGQRERLIPIPERTLFWLKLYQDEVRTPLWAPRKELSFVFLSTGGRHLSRVHAWRLIQKYATQIGIRHCTPHTLRHAFASHLVQHGADLRSVQSLLGHQSLRATQIYTRVGPKHLEDLVTQHHLLS